MAVIESLGLAVSVLIGGVPAAEYNDPDPDPDVEHKYPAAKVVSKYIEAISDAEYAIRCDALPTHEWLPTNRDNVIRYDVKIDGQEQACKILHASRWDRTRGGSTTAMGKVRTVTGSQGILNKFRFSAVNLIDDANHGKVQEDLKRAKRLGMIRISIFRGLDLHTRKPQRGRSDEGKNDQDLSVAEKALKGKAVSHGTTFAPATQIKAPMHMDVQWIDDTPWAVFDFKYRSRNALRSEMILPRTPSPSPVPSLSGLEDLDNLSQEAIQRLARERLAEIRNQRAVKREASGVKREFEELLDAPSDRKRNVRPKREQPDGKRAAEPLIVDLTGD